MDTVATILQVLLGLVFLIFGLGRIFGTRKSKERFDKWRYPGWFQPLAGWFELIGAVGMFASIFLLPIASVAGLWLCALMIFSLYTHLIRVKDRAWVVPSVLFLFSAVVVGTRLMALLIGLLLLAVTPDPAPLAIIPSAEVVSFANDAPELFESIAFDRQGNMYVTLASKGEIRKISPEGIQATLAQLPSGKFNLYKLEGILATLVVDLENNLYVTVGAVDPQNRGIWKVTPDGVSELWAKLPPEACPNGITMDNDGNLFVADSVQQSIWRVPRNSRQVELWIQHKMLGATGNRFLPGPNGVKFWKGALYVSVTNERHIVRIPVQPDGSAGDPNIYIKGIPADDIVFDEAGNLYLTTHFFNTVIRVSPDGSRAIIATADEGVVGPTAAVFGRVPGEEDKLFVVNDGGFGNPLAKGIPNVVRLDIGIRGQPIP